MQFFHSGALEGIRFTGDRSAHGSLLEDPNFRPFIDSFGAEGAMEVWRGQLLAQAVRVDVGLLPDLSKALTDVAERAKITKPLEAYVYCDAHINASVTDSQSRVFVLLSSAAIEKLDREELDFVIGHELGHAAYGHLELPVDAILQSGAQVTAQQAMRLRAWQRKAEISADRAGLICCGSLEVAARSLFKVWSGLSMPGVTVDPNQFAAQWDHLVEHHVSQGQGTHWDISHPFPSMRMKAMNWFWRSETAMKFVPHATGDLKDNEVEREIESLLAMMDPLARKSGDGPDPLLQPFILWGGLFITLANGAADDRELDRLNELVGRSAVEQATSGEMLTAQACYERFVEARGARRAPLSALELHRIFSAIVSVCTADGLACESEQRALAQLANACGVNEGFVNTMMAKAA
ncbi:MAG: M48 family metallopeptidase [Phycisphaerales bacterium]